MQEEGQTSQNGVLNNIERTADGGAEGQPTKETETLPLSREAEQEISREGSSSEKREKLIRSRVVDL